MKIRGWIIYMMLIGAGALMALLLCEMGLRFTKRLSGLGVPAELYIRDAHVGFRNRPGFRARVAEREYEMDIRINSNGFRADRDFSFTKPENIQRIAVLGDSFAFGFGVDNEDTISNEMQVRLGGRYEVINMGVGGFDTTREVAFLQAYGLFYDPDILLLFMFLGNDILTSYTPMPFFYYEDQKETYLFHKVISAFKGFMRRFHLYHFVTRRTNILRRKGRPERMPFDYIMLKNYSVDAERKIEETKQVLAKLRDLSAKRGMLLAVVMVPIRDQVVDDRWIKIRVRESFYQRDKLQEIMGNAFNELGINYLDLLPLMRSYDKRNLLYYTRDPHCTALGYRFIAEKAVEFLRANRFLVTP